MRKFGVMLITMAILAGAGAVRAQEPLPHTHKCFTVSVPIYIFGVHLWTHNHHYCVPLQSGEYHGVAPTAAGVATPM